MSDIKACVACAEEIKIEAKLCRHCQTRQDDPTWTSDTVPENMVLLTDEQRRVPQGSIELEEWALGESKLVEIGSVEHQQADASFDPTVQPSKDDLVPADCAWAVFPWPGPMPGHLVPGPLSAPNPQKFFGSLGDVRGWTYSEFERCAGTPFNRAGVVDGVQTVIWSHGSLFGAWSASFHFDQYGVCMGFGNETAF